MAGSPSHLHSEGLKWSCFEPAGDDPKYSTSGGGFGVCCGDMRFERRGLVDGNPSVVIEEGDLTLAGVEG